jgi:hypothetical protein
LGKTTTEYISVYVFHNNDDNPQREQGCEERRQKRTYSTTTSTSLRPIRSGAASRAAIMHVDEFGGISCHFFYASSLSCCLSLYVVELILVCLSRVRVYSAGCRRSAGDTGSTERKGSRWWGEDGAGHVTWKVSGERGIVIGGMKCLSLDA